ncbi:hypothetical protein EIP86_010271 [Pleurotus ostreatoroseus]|nr:hypothetical protein EIP86_010271 [Pleurotus ostreatoroseus]
MLEHEAWKRARCEGEHGPVRQFVFGLGSYHCAVATDRRGNERPPWTNKAEWASASGEEGGWDPQGAATAEPRTAGRFSGGKLPAISGAGSQ